MDLVQYILLAIQCVVLVIQAVILQKHAKIFQNQMSIQEHSFKSDEFYRLYNHLKESGFDDICNRYYMNIDTNQPSSSFSTDKLILLINMICMMYMNDVIDKKLFDILLRVNVDEVVFRLCSKQDGCNDKSTIITQYWKCYCKKRK